MPKQTIGLNFLLRSNISISEELSRHAADLTCPCFEGTEAFV